MFDPARATLQDKIASGRCLGVVWLALGSLALVEAAVRSRPDAIVIDVQHGLWDRRDLEAAIGLVPPDLPVIVRASENSQYAIGMALDAGAEGVMVPLIETEKQARSAISYAKYPPHGVRSGGGFRPLADFATYVEAQDKLVVLLMIETVKGIKNASKIAAVDGVDMVFIGTGDLAMSLGTFPNMHPDHAAACTEIQRACSAEKTPCGIFTPNPDVASLCRDQGYGMVVLANDMDVVARGFSSATSGFAASLAPSTSSSPTPDSLKPTEG